MTTIASGAGRRVAALLSVVAIAAALIVAGAGAAHASIPGVDDTGTFTVETDITDAVVTGFSSGPSSLDLVIPNTVMVGGTPYRVASIDENAFRGWGLTSVTVPSDLSSVLSGAFVGNAITTVTITGSSVPTGLGNELSAGGGYVWSASTVYDPAASWKNLETDGAPVPGTFHLVSTSISQRDDDSGQWSVTVTDGSATIDGRGAANGATDLVIPSTIEIGGVSFPVTDIGYQAFQNVGLTSVVLPNDLKTVGIQAFEGNSLASLTIPDSVWGIYADAFAKNQLTAITIPDTVTLLGDGAFEENKIASATLPSGITVIPNRLLSMNKLTSIKIPAGVTAIGQFALSDNLLESVTIPTGVTEIGDNAFYNNKLTAIDIPDGVTSVERFAFGFNQITSATLPNSLTEISPYLFAENQLATVSIPATVTLVGEGAFVDNDLTTVIIPNAVTQIDKYAFQGNKLTSVALGSGLTTIGPYAFAKNRIALLTLPASVTSIGVAAFYDNDIGGTVAIPDGVVTISDSTFRDNKLTGVTLGLSVTLVAPFAFANNEITSLTIPNHVGFIAEGSFRENQIASLDLGNGLEAIGATAFLRNNLTALVIPDSVSAISNLAFAYNEISDLDLGDGVVSLHDGSFYDNQLGSIALPASVTSVGADAFTVNPLTKIEFKGAALPSGIGAAFVPSPGSAYDRNAWSPTSSFDRATAYTDLTDPRIAAPSTIYLVPIPHTAPPPAPTVTPAPPSFDDADITYTIPSTEGVEYLVDGTVKTAGRWPASAEPEDAQTTGAAPAEEHASTFLAVPSTKENTVVVTARVLTGYELAGGAVTSWAHTYKAPATPGAPVSSEPSQEAATESTTPEQPALMTSLYRDFTAKVPGVEVDGQGGAYLTDRVSYTGLTVGTEYSLSGRLVYEDGSDTGITGKAAFTAEASTGSVPVVFHLTPSQIKRGSSMLIAFEVLSEADSGTATASHEDLSAAEQQITLTLLSQSTNIYFGGDWYPSPQIHAGLGASARQVNPVLVGTGIGLLALLGAAAVVGAVRRRRGPTSVETLE